jgi:hypothetical protein
MWATFYKPKGIYLEKWFVVGILRVKKGLNVDVLDF